ncbi:ABC transporter permease [Geomicrobium sp. JSM 1781026]|uniref:ABC transporter permease n=1 Tax=Geomicrobium sp. JSM 1781026 TaxID=3344580 RepID=UPI0035C218C2
MNLIGVDGMFGLPFSSQAVIQTMVVFIGLILITSVQIILIVYRSTLLQLFHATKRAERINKRPNMLSAILALTGIGLIVFGYFISTLMIEHADSLLFLMLLVLSSTIFGTYLIFHTTISWMLYLFRRKQRGNLGLYHSLSVASLMHRLKGHANSLTLITVLSAMTITMISLSYSLYYSTENDVRLAMPFDFAVEDMPQEAGTISNRLEEEQIDFHYAELHAIRFDGTWTSKENNADARQRTFLLFSSEQLAQAGVDVKHPDEDEAIYHNTRAIIEGMELSFPKEVQFKATNDEEMQLTVSSFKLENVMNYRFFGDQLIVSEPTFQSIRENIQVGESAEELTYETFQLLDADQSDVASDIFLGNIDNDLFITDFHTSYEQSIQTFGLLIFIAGFLGIVFLLSTGSILYFKQMTEAEQEKGHYRTLRQLGFQVNDIMKGIIRKQLFVYIIPLAIGLLHAAFALNVGSVLIVASMLTPIIMSMAAYITIYLMFTILTIRYYRSIVRKAL